MSQFSSVVDVCLNFHARAHNGLAVFVHAPRRLGEPCRGTLNNSP
jgi:hypothetical protein